MTVLVMARCHQRLLFTKLTVEAPSEGGAATLCLWLIFLV